MLMLAHLKSFWVRTAAQTFGRKCLSKSRFFEALHRFNIPVEMHIYAEGGHGLALANEETSYPDGYGIQKECQSWIGLAQQWLLRL